VARTGLAMPDLSAKRTLVKSPPELWEELSEVERLAKHLGAFGEIRITKLEPGHTVAWEGEHASGTVSIEPSGWGTKVTLTAELAAAAEPGSDDPGGAEPEEQAGNLELADVELEEPAAARGPDDVEPQQKAAAPKPGAVEPQQAATLEPDDVEPQSLQPVEQAGDELDAWTPDEPDAPDAGESAEERPARRRRGFWAWLFRPRRAEQHPAEESSGAPPAEPEPEEPASVAPSAEPEPDPEEWVPEAAQPEPVSEAPPAEPEPEPDEPTLEAPPTEPEPDEPVMEAPPSEHEPDEPIMEAPPIEPEPDAPIMEAPPIEPEPDEPASDAPPAQEPEPDGDAAEDLHPAGRLDLESAQAVLHETLDALGSAHHRPFSRG
jgi:hypothetical protein